MGFKQFSIGDFKEAMAKGNIEHGVFFNPQSGKMVELIGYSSTDKKNNKLGKASKNWKSIRKNMLKKNLLDEVKEIDASVEKLSKLPFRELRDKRRAAGVKVRAGRTKKGALEPLSEPEQKLHKEHDPSFDKKKKSSAPVKPVVTGTSQEPKKEPKIVSKEVAPGKVVAKEVLSDTKAPNTDKQRAQVEKESIERLKKQREGHKFRYGDIGGKKTLDKNAGNIRQKITMEVNEKEQDKLQEKRTEVENPEEDIPAHQTEDTHHKVGGEDFSQLDKFEGDKPFGGAGLVGQTGFSKGHHKFRGRDTEPTDALPSVSESQVDIPRDTEVVEIEKGGIQPMISGGFSQEQEISMEMRKRIRKTDRDLKVEIDCFRQLFKDLIKDPLFLALNGTSLDGKSITQLRRIHEQYSELIRGYYEKGRGLKIGVIVDPQVLNLNLLGLQQMFSNQMDNTNRVVRSSAESKSSMGKKMEGGRVIGSSDSHEPSKKIMVGDIHYARGGLAVSQQKPPPKEMRGLAKGLDLNSRQNHEVSIGKKAVPTSFINFKNYKMPARRETHVKIKIGK